MCKGLVWGGFGKAFVQVFKTISVVREALVCSLYSFFFLGKTTKQQYHVISCLFPEPEIPALLQAALLIKQMGFARLVSKPLSGLTAATGKRVVLVRRCSQSGELVARRG